MFSILLNGDEAVCEVVGWSLDLSPTHRQRSQMNRLFGPDSAVIIDREMRCV
jgi:hypothetical protein